MQLTAQSVETEIKYTLLLKRYAFSTCATVSWTGRHFPIWGFHFSTVFKATCWGWQHGIPCL